METLFFVENQMHNNTSVRKELLSERDGNEAGLRNQESGVGEKQKRF